VRQGVADRIQTPSATVTPPSPSCHHAVKPNAQSSRLPDGEDRGVKTDGCVKILSVRDPSAEPTGFMFSADGSTAYLSIQHSNDASMPKVDDYATDDILKITGFKPVKKKGTARN
jgi:secreted PhoX family phosphatase